jgi:hypothetical protein
MQKWRLFKNEEAGSVLAEYPLISMKYLKFVDRKNAQGVSVKYCPWFLKEGNSVLFRTF